jgi:pyocin large subunit-like protein
MTVPPLADAASVAGASVAAAASVATAASVAASVAAGPPQAVNTIEARNNNVKTVFKNFISSSPFGFCS